MKHVLSELARSARPRAPWWLLSAVGIAVVPVLAAGEPAIGFWRWVMIGAAVGAGLMSRFSNRNPAAHGIVVVAAVLHLTLLHPVGSYRSTVSESIEGAMLDVCVVLALASLLTLATIRRAGPPRPKDVVEVMVVALGASIATWVILTRPLIDDGMSPWRAGITSAVVPLTVLVTTFLIDLWNDGLRPNRALQLACVAAISITTASISGRLDLLADSPGAAPVIPFIGFSMAAGFMFAAMSHPHFQRDMIAVDPSRDVAASKPRLAIMGVAVLASVISMSMVAPEGDPDLLIRSLGTVAMIVLVVARVAIASVQQEAARATLQRRINLDDLTGLPTRSRIIEVVTQRLDETWRTGRYPSVFHLNVDRFKHINDSLGHQGANEVLVQIARRLESAAAPFGADVGRLGGDDFVVVDASTHNLAEAMKRVDAFRAALDEPVLVDGTTVAIGASIGVAVAPEKRTTSAEELLRRANVANHQAKLEGTSRIAVFDDAMQATVAKRMDLEHALHGAIGRREMRLFHQPIIDVTTGRVSGFESLIRWQRNNGDLVPPGAFITIAEDTGIICELGAWALNDALERLRGWIDTGVVAPDTTISVNVSPRQIADPNFADHVRYILERTGVPPSLLWLEITESMMLEQPDLAETTLRDIRRLGVRIALDDFGTGFSSLSLLQRFPIDRIKIDRAFVQGIADNTNDRSLVRTIIAMAHSMGLDLVAEGVETIHQLQSLRDLGCNKAQGYLISHPVPPDAMRSTMSALDELATLSVFRSEDLVRSLAAEPAPISTVAAPAPAPIGAGTRGPLGQPVI